MSKIKSVKGRQVFDSRGNPTVEAEIILQDETTGTSIVPSGASTGRYEAHELRDNNNNYLNKSVFDAVKNINNKISKVLENEDSTSRSIWETIRMPKRPLLWGGGCPGGQLPYRPLSFPYRR